MSAGVTDGQSVNANVTNGAFLSATQGSEGFPILITAAGGVSFSAPQERNQYYIAGNSGPVTITANPQITAGQTVCQTITFIGQDSTNTVTFVNGNGLSLSKSSITLGLNQTLVLMWTSSTWIEIPTPTNAGTVTSVGLADNSTNPIFSVTGSPVTNSGTLGLVLANELANKVFAGPSGGASAQPSFRSLVSGDFPNSGASAGTYTNATITVDAHGIVTAAANGSAAAAINSFIRRAGPSAYGSGTAIAIFGTAIASSGSDISYTTSAGSGDAYTINTAGIYNVVVDLARGTAGNMAAGISVNASSAGLATSITSLGYANGMRSWAEIGNAGVSPAVWTGYLAAGDIVRCHTDGTALANDTVNAYIEVTRIL